jgi:hypothetical protein
MHAHMAWRGSIGDIVVDAAISWIDATQGPRDVEPFP